MRAIKVAACDSAETRPHTLGSRERVEMTTTSEKYVCVCGAFVLASISAYISKVKSHFWLKFGMGLSIYGALMLLNFCGNRGRG